MEGTEPSGEVFNPLTEHSLSTSQSAVDAPSRIDAEPFSNPADIQEVPPPISTVRPPIFVPTPNTVEPQAYERPTRQEAVVQSDVGEPSAATANTGTAYDYAKEIVFRVEQTTSAWQTAKDALEAGMTGLSNVTAPKRTGGRRGRGPRRNISPIPSDTITLRPNGSSTPSASTSPFPTPVRGQSTPRRARGAGSRGGRGARKSFSGTKRKRHGTDSDSEGGDSSTSEEITNLPTQSRSGRKITQATHHTPNVKFELEDKMEYQSASPLATPSLPPQHGIRTPVMAAPSPKPATAAVHPWPSMPSSARPTPQKNGRKTTKRTPGASAVCKNCGRGHSPASNAIVFCDGCNTPWHQHCHDPPIKQDFLTHVDRDWYCGDCTMLREHTSILEGKVAGHGMSMLDVSPNVALQRFSHPLFLSHLSHTRSRTNPRSRNENI